MYGPSQAEGGRKGRISRNTCVGKTAFLHQPYNWTPRGKNRVRN